MKKRKSRKKPISVRRELQQALFAEPPIKIYKAPKLLTTTLAGNRMRDAEGILLDKGTHAQVLTSQGQRKVKVTSAPKKQRLTILSCLAKKAQIRREYLAFKSLGRGSGSKSHNNRFTVEC